MKKSEISGWKDKSRSKKERCPAESGLKTATEAPNSAPLEYFPGVLALFFTIIFKLETHNTVVCNF